MSIGAFGVRLVPLERLKREYLGDQRATIAGFWMLAEPLRGLSRADVIEAVGTGWRRADGAAPFSQDHIGFLRFPLTDLVRRASRSSTTVSAGGSLPDPPLRVQWPGTGFAPGPLLLPELLLRSVSAPVGTAAGELEPDGTWRVLARWDGHRWSAA